MYQNYVDIKQNFVNIKQLVSSTDISNQSRSLPLLDLSGLVCREDFFERNFTCLPRCALWEQYPPQEHMVLDVIWALSLITMLLGSVAIIGTFATRRKQM